MNKIILAQILAFILVVPAGVVLAVEPSQEELDTAHRWVAGWAGDGGTPAGEYPFSFLYGGAASPGLLGGWPVERKSERLDDARTRHTLVFTDPETRLVVRCEAVEYAAFPAVEWTLHFANRGEKDTPLLEEVQAFDARFFAGQAGEKHRLLYSLGSHEQPRDFTPREQGLDAPVRLAPYGGRSSDGVLPFFNLAAPDGGGLVMGIGWTGQWAASFVPAADGGAALRAGMELTRLRLHPGEEIRTPAILLLFWSGGDSLRGNNLLRRLLLEHYTPRPGGKPVEPPVAASPHGVIAFSDSTEENMLRVVDALTARKFPVDTFWIDAGWNGDQKEWARSVGSWEPNRERYPRGMKPVADAARAGGYRFLLWFEPERVMPGTWLHENHPEWLRTPAGLPPELMYQKNDKFYLLDLGNPEALAWAKTTFSGMIGGIGIDIFRQDFNMTPLHYWRNGEAEDRRGMNEIRHVTGLYDFYDTLLREHPGLLIDNCASGGRRIDFEIMRRALTLTRSDCLWEPTAQHAMNHGISLWVPVTGIGAVSMNPYNFRSGMGAHMSLALDYLNSPDLWEPAAAAVAQYRDLRRLFTGDYYPLTPHSLDRNRWLAWQFDTPGAREGIIQAFRREECPGDSLHVLPRGLDPAARYTVTDLDTNTPVEMSGRDLLEQGLTLRAPQAPGSVFIHYKAAK